MGSVGALALPWVWLPRGCPCSGLCPSVLQMVCERSDAFASACALARAFPLFTHRSGAARRTEKKTVTVEFFLVGQDNGPVEVSTLQVGVQMFAPCPRPACAAAAGRGGGQRSLCLPDPGSRPLPRGGTPCQDSGGLYWARTQCRALSCFSLSILSARVSVPLCGALLRVVSLDLQNNPLRSARLGGTPG